MYIYNTGNDKCVINVTIINIIITKTNNTNTFGIFLKNDLENKSDFDLFLN